MIYILGYFDVGYNDDSAEVITEIIVRCGNPADRSAVDIAITHQQAKSGNSFCPEKYPVFVGAVSDNDD